VVDWIGLAQDRDRWRALVNSVLSCGGVQLRCVRRYLDWRGLLVVPSIVYESARCSDASCRSRRGHQYVGRVKRVFTERVNKGAYHPQQSINCGDTVSTEPSSSMKCWETIECPKN
jgi:hypothetical protein